MYNGTRKNKRTARQSVFWLPSCRQSCSGTEKREKIYSTQEGHSREASINASGILSFICTPPYHCNIERGLSCEQELSAKINRSIENQMVAAASSGGLTIMKSTASGWAHPILFLTKTDEKYQAIVKIFGKDKVMMNYPYSNSIRLKSMHCLCRTHYDSLSCRPFGRRVHMNARVLHEEMPC